MKVSVTRKELRECVEAAFDKVMSEKRWDDDNFDNENDRNKKQFNNSKNFKKNSPKHAKMGPMKKDKYRNNYGEDY